MTEATLRFKQAAFNGVTMVELVMAMMIIAVLSVGVASLMRVGIEAQLSERANQKMQIISMAIVDDLRRDLQTAQAVTVQNAGNTLVVRVPDPADPASAYNATYRLANGLFSRTSPEGSKDYIRDIDMRVNSKLTVKCVNDVNASAPCFRWLNATTKTVLKMEGLRLEHTGFGNTVFDQNFGSPNYTVRDLTFDVSINREFK